MREFDDFDDGSGSANDRRWRCLLRLTEKLSEGKIELDQLVKEVEKSKSENVALDHGILKKNNSVVVRANEVETSGRSCKKSGMKINNFKVNHGKVSDVVCNQDHVSSKKTIKKPSREISMERESLKNAEQNPNSKGIRRVGFEKEEGLPNKKAKKRSDQNMSILPYDEPPLPEAFKNCILDSCGCVESPFLVIQKELYRTDVSTNHGRLSIPYRKVKNEFLRSAEIDQLKLTSRGILVNVVQPSLKECQMSLRSWKSNSMYALVSDWNEVRRNNALREGMVIQLWSFRRNSALCFALVRIR